MVQLRQMPIDRETLSSRTTGRIGILTRLPPDRTVAKHSLEGYATQHHCDYRHIVLPNVLRRDTAIPKCDRIFVMCFALAFADGSGPEKKHVQLQGLSRATKVRTRRDRFDLTFHPYQYNIST